MHLPSRTHLESHDNQQGMLFLRRCLKRIRVSKTQAHGNFHVDVDPDHSCIRYDDAPTRLQSYKLISITLSVPVGSFQIFTIFIPTLSTRAYQSRSVRSAAENMNIMMMSNAVLFMLALVDGMTISLISKRDDGDMAGLIDWSISTQRSSGQSCRIMWRKYADAPECVRHKFMKGSRLTLDRLRLEEIMFLYLDAFCIFQFFDDLFYVLQDHPTMSVWMLLEKLVQIVSLYMISTARTDRPRRPTHQASTHIHHEHLFSIGSIQELLTRINIGPIFSYRGHTPHGQVEMLCKLNIAASHVFEDGPGIVHGPGNRCQSGVRRASILIDFQIGW